MYFDTGSVTSYNALSCRIIIAAMVIGLDIDQIGKMVFGDIGVSPARPELTIE